VTLAAAMLVRWIALAATAGVIGSLAVFALVVPSNTPGVEAVRRRLQAVAAVCTIVLIVTSAAELLLRARTMGGGDLARAIAVVPLVLARTQFGTIWLARSVALLVLVVVVWMPGAWAPRIALAVSSGVALTTALSGHASDWGTLTASVALDWIHVLAAAAWVGGLFALAVIVVRTTSLTLPDFVPMAKRFSRLAGWSLATVLLTGLYNAWVQLPDLRALRDTPYGRVLLMKVTLVATLAALGGLNRYVLIPALTGGRQSDRLSRFARRGRLLFFGVRRPSASRLIAVILCETAVGGAVLGLTAVLGESTPARHAGHVSHVSDVDAGAPSIRATMEQLHATGGVPRGWMFRVPPGDAARGRQVFARLQCFRCHQLRGESFPAPSAGGPELTEASAHHPVGYLVESILNPNAVIVEGPGYIGSDGRSTMPDYRDELSARDLIDLVAYLQTQ
jgi:putative copper resistance protein D